MSHRLLRFPASVILALLALAGCTAMENAPAPEACNVTAAQQLVGLVRPTDADAARVSGATIVRQISPGDEVTEDWRENRVTIETDPATGLIVRSFCG